MCTPREPVACYKYEDCGPPGCKANDGPSNAGGSGAQKREKGHQLKLIRSRELRGGVMYYSCHCIKRNGLQHDCRRTGCGGEPGCVTMDNPVCPPSQLARAQGLAAPLAVSTHNLQPLVVDNNMPLPGIPTLPGTFGGKTRYIICEVKNAKDDGKSENPGASCNKCDLPSSGKPR